MNEGIFKVENIKRNENGIVSVMDWDNMSSDDIVNIIEYKYNHSKNNPKRQEREIIWEVAEQYYNNSYVISNSKGKPPKENALKTSTIFVLLENLIAKMFRLMFHGNKVITVEPDSEDTPAKYAQILEKWFNKILEKNNYRKKFTRLLKQFLIYGNGCIKVGWYQKEYMRKVRKMTEYGYTVVENRKFVEKYPYFDVVDMHDVYPDPDANKEEDITYVIQVVRKRLSTLLQNREQYENFSNFLEFVNNKLSKQSAEKIKQSLTSGQTLDRTDGVVSPNDEYDPIIEMKYYYEEDRLIIVAENVVLYNGENPYWNKTIPFIFIGNYDSLNSYYSAGEVENCIAFQEAEDVATQMTLDYLKSLLKLKLLVPDSAKIDEDALKSMDNRIVRADIPGEIQPLNIPAINISPAMAVSQSMINKMEEVTSMTEYQRGAPARQETAAGVYQIVEAGNTKFLFKVDMFEPMLKKLSQWMVDLQHQFMDDFEKIKTKDEVGNEIWMDITPEIFSYAYKYKFIGSANAENKSLLFNKAMTLYNMLANRPDIQQDYLLEYVLNIADYPNLNIEKLIKEQGISGMDRILKQKELGLLGQGKEKEETKNIPGIPLEEQLRLQTSEAGNPLNILNGGFNG